jgi:hypothetical protein
MKELMMSQRIPLCVFSQAAGGVYVDARGVSTGKEFVPQTTCPLGLSRTQGAHCPCKRREDAGQVKKDRNRVVGVQVATCAFPNTWQGKPIRSVEGLTKWIKAQAGAAPQAIEHHAPKPIADDDEQDLIDYSDIIADTRNNLLSIASLINQPGQPNADEEALIAAYEVLAKYTRRRV